MTERFCSFFKESRSQFNVTPCFCTIPSQSTVRTSYVGKGGQRGHVPSEIATLNFFSLKSIEFLTFNQIFSIIFRFLGALPQTPPGALYPAGDGTHSFVPSETNSWLRPWSGLLVTPLVLILVFNPWDLYYTKGMSTYSALSSSKNLYKNLY